MKEKIIRGYWPNTLKIKKYEIPMVYCKMKGRKIGYKHYPL